MRCALGFAVHTGWAAYVLAGGSIQSPLIESRERIDLLGDAERFVFHRAAEMSPDKAKEFVAQTARDARAAAVRAIRKAVEGRDVAACAIVARPNPMPPLAQVVASHPMIHTAEGLFYRDVLRAAAEQVGVSVQVVSPKTLDTKNARLTAVGRAIGKPWNADFKLAALAAWTVLEPGARKA
jgi:hypothetical protein